MQPLGKIQKLWRFPVKSMGGEELSKAHLSFTGLVGDRVFAFVDPEARETFPWLTAREVPEMICYSPRFVLSQEIEQPYPQTSAFQVQVKTPEGNLHLVDDPEFLESLRRRWGRKFSLRFSEKGMQDSRPLSIFGTSTLAKVTEELGMPVDPLRFRPNILVEWNNPDPLFEETLIGKPLKIGTKASIVITKKDPRCIIINLEPGTAAGRPEVLKHVGKAYKGQIGVYAVVVQEGVVAVGDEISFADT